MSIPAITIYKMKQVSQTKINWKYLKIKFQVGFDSNIQPTSR